MPRKQSIRLHLDNRPAACYRTSAVDDCLFAELDHFLAARRETSRLPCCRGFWQDRVITLADLTLLKTIGKVVRCPAEVAALLDRCPVETAQLLDALSSIGLVERHQDGYVASDAALRYCLAVQDDRL